jgi:transcriptional regulator with XRE-family HTH domain
MQDQILLKEFGLRIRQLCTDRDLSQEELSFQTGFHRTYIGMVEQNSCFQIQLINGMIIS